MWAYRDPVSGTCYFDCHTGRDAECLLEMLGYDETTNTLGYTGVIHTDGYAVYDSVASRFGLHHGGCLAHVRREFTDLGKASPEVTIPVLLYIQQIYRIETHTKQTGAPPACRELIRRSRSLPIARELHQFIVAHLTDHRPASDVRKALQYTLNQWHKILHGLSQGVMEIDTNGVENIIRPTKLGMKNWLFVGGETTGQCAAIIYTLVECAKRHGHNSEAYLTDVLECLPAMTNQDDLTVLLPANWQTAPTVAAPAATGCPV